MHVAGGKGHEPGGGPRAVGSMERVPGEEVVTEGEVLEEGSPVAVIEVVGVGGDMDGEEHSC